MNNAAAIIETYYTDLGSTEQKDDLDQLKAFFASDAFNLRCSEVFHQVDLDRSLTIDKQELLDAFNRVFAFYGSKMTEAVREFGSSVQTASKTLGQKLISLHWSSLAGHASCLSPEQFVGAVQIMFLEGLSYVAKSKQLAAKRLEAAQVLLNAKFVQLGNTPRGAKTTPFMTKLFASPDFSLTVQRIFYQADADHSGEIDKEECVKAAGVVYRELAPVLQQLDLFPGPQQDGLNREVLHTQVLSAWSYFDQNRSGGLDVKEFSLVVKLFFLEVLFQVLEREMEAELSKRTMSADKLLQQELKLLRKNFKSGAQKETDLLTHFASQEFFEVSQRVFVEVDQDKSGSVDKEEGFAAVGTLIEKLPGVEHAIVELQHKVDEFMLSLYKEVLEDVWDVVDVNGDGELQFDEFLHMIKLVWIKCCKIVLQHQQQTDFENRHKMTKEVVQSELSQLFNLYGGQPSAQRLESWFCTPDFHSHVKSVFSESTRILEEEEDDEEGEGGEGGEGGGEEEKSVDLSSLVAGSKKRKASGSEGGPSSPVSVLQQKPKLTVAVSAGSLSSDITVQLEDQEISREQSLAAVRTIMERTPGVLEALTVLNSTIQDASKSMADQVNKQLWSVLDWDGSDTLDLREFCQLVKIITIHCMKLVVRAEGGTKMIEHSLSELNVLLGPAAVGATRHTFTSHAFEELVRHVFKESDLDNSGTLEGQEECLRAFQALISATDVLKIDVQALMANYGVCLSSFVQQTGAAILSNAWCVVDADGNGKLEIQEFILLAKLIYIETRKIGSKLMPRNKLEALVESKVEQFVNERGHTVGDKLRIFFHSDDFASGVKAVFTQVDHDKSQTIDPGECSEAFFNVMASHQEVLTVFGNNADLLKQSVVLDTQALFQRGVFKGLKELNFEQFTQAVKLCYIELHRKLFPAKPRQVSVFMDDTDTAADIGGAYAKQEFGEGIVGNLLVLLAKKSATSAEFMRQYFLGKEFQAQCVNVANQVDTDKNVRISKRELLHAFTLLINCVPGIRENISKHLNVSQSPDAYITQLGKELIEQVFDYMDFKGTGELELDGFVMAIKALWLKVLTKEQ